MEAFNGRNSTYYLGDLIRQRRPISQLDVEIENNIDPATHVNFRAFSYIRIQV